MISVNIIFYSLHKIKNLQLWEFKFFAKDHFYVAWMFYSYERVETIVGKKETIFSFSCNVLKGSLSGSLKLGQFGKEFTCDIQSNQQNNSIS